MNNDKLGFLTLSRKKDQSLLIGDEIEIAVSRIDHETGTVKISIKAPKNMKILRKEARKCAST